MGSNTVFGHPPDSDKYCGILYKRLHLPPGGNDPLDWLVQKTTHDFHVQHSKKRFGNREGFALLDAQGEAMEKVMRELLEIKGRVDALQEQNVTLQAQNVTLENRNSALEKDTAALKTNLSTLTNVHIGIRRGVLEERRVFNRAGARKDREATNFRNEIAHGGDIIGDIRAIQYAQEQQQPYVAEYKEDFQKVYRISFDEALTQAPSYPPEAIRAFDILASVTELNAWQARDQRERRDTLKKQAIEIIDAVLSTEKSQLRARFGNGEDLLVAFNEMAGLFMAGR